MSTKIYDGMRAASSTDPFTLGSRIREVIQPIFYGLVQTYANNITLRGTIQSADEGRKVLDSLGEFDLFLEEKHKEAILTLNNGLQWHTAARAVYACMDYLHTCREHTFSGLDFGYDVVLLPGSDNKPLVLVYTAYDNMCRGSSQIGYRQALKEAGVLEEYGYWDNSDALEGVTEEEWTQRGKDWGVIRDTPAQAGLIIHHPSPIDTEVALLKTRE